MLSKRYESTEVNRRTWIHVNLPWRSGESTGLWNQGSWVWFSQKNIYLRIKLFIFSLSFLFIFLNFQVNNVRIYIESTRIPDLNRERSQSFLFFKIAYTPNKGTIRHIAWLHVSSSLFKIQCFYRDENDLTSDDEHYIRGKRNTWQHFWSTITRAAVI